VQVKDQWLGAQLVLQLVVEWEYE
jgi:hypothetical protein